MKVRRVAVLIESSRAFGRALLEGVAAYARTHRNWSIYFQPRGLETAIPEWLSDWQGDGILVRVQQQRVAEQILKTGIPTIDLRGTSRLDGLPRLAGDNAEISRLAFEHLRGCGMKQFAFCGLTDRVAPLLDDRRDQFRKQCNRAELPLETWPLPSDSPDQTAFVNWDDEQRALANWLKSLPKPIGIMACHDDRGFQVLEACRRAGIRVPDEIAVVGVDNDTVICDLAEPALSSVDPDGQRIGYTAAEQLERMMAGRPVSRKLIRLPPRGLVIRPSSDTIAIADEDVAAAIRRIRTGACTGASVVELFAEIPVSRSTLERRFSALMGRTPKEEMLRVQIETARLLLRETDASLRQVARKAGFRSDKYFSDAFLRETGVRPSAYRKQQRRDL